MGQQHFRVKRFTTSHVVSVLQVGSLEAAVPIDFRNAAGGFFEVDDADLTTITWYTLSGAEGATRVAANTEAGVAITQTVADNKSYAIPAALYGAAYLIPIGNNAGTIRVDLKS